MDITNQLEFGEIDIVVKILETLTKDNSLMEEWKVRQVTEVISALKDMRDNDIPIKKFVD